MTWDRERWNAKYAGPMGTRADALDAFVERCLEREEAVAQAQAGGRALDLAAGTGRHALELARRGFQTEAWDVSDVGLARLDEKAAAAGLRVVTRCFDVLREDGSAERFDFVVVVNFLERELLARLAERVAPGGMLCFTTFTQDWPGSRPPRRFRLEPGELGGELRAGFAAFETLLEFEADGRAGWLGRCVAAPH